MKARRKKTKKGTTTESITTPRTKAAIAREAAEKTRKEAMEAELKAAAAREAAARQEAMAARLEFSATQAHEEVMDVMSLQVVVPDASNQTTRAMRYCSSPTDIELHVSGIPL